MSIFRRRVVQRELDVLRPRIVKPEQGRDLVQRLNGSRRQAIAAEWEVVLLASLSRLATVQYEARFNNVRLDLFVRDGKGTEFVGDIVAPSDTDIAKRNPADFLFEEFRRVASSRGFNNGGFDIRIADHIIGHYPDKQTKLLLPNKGDIPHFLERELAPFFQVLRTNPTESYSIHCVRPGVDFVITYNPKLIGAITGGYASPAAPMSLRRNPLFANLNSKATKLRNSAYPGVRGIFVTDGGCSSLSSEGSGGSPWSRDQIVERFLRDHPVIDFVTTTTLRNRGGWSKTEHYLSNKIYWKRPFNETLTAKLYPLINEAFRQLPAPFESPHNAWQDVRSRKQISRGCRLGACSWTPTRKLSISCRTFVSLIAGTLSERDFKLLFHRATPAHRVPLLQFFNDLIQTGSRLGSVRVDYCADEDDDLMIFATGIDMELQFAPIENSCEMPTAVLVRYIAGLDYEMVAGRPNHSTLATISSDIQGMLRRLLDEGRMLIAAQLMSGGEMIRLTFGARDAAISDYV